MGRGVGETRAGEGANANACARCWRNARAGEGANANACAKRSDQAKAKARADGRGARRRQNTQAKASANACTGRGQRASVPSTRNSKTLMFSCRSPNVQARCCGVATRMASAKHRDVFVESPLDNRRSGFARKTSWGAVQMSPWVVSGCGALSWFCDHCRQHRHAVLANAFTRAWSRSLGASVVPRFARSRHRRV